MYLKLSAVLFGICLLSAPSFAQTTIRANCEDLKGLRVDFIKGEFKNDTDGITGSKPQLFYDFSTKKGYYTSTDTAKQTDNVEIVNLAQTEDMLGFAGVVNGAPVLITIYPKEKIMLYSEQGIMALPNTTWPKAKMFWSKCEVK